MTSTVTTIDPTKEPGYENPRNIILLNAPPGSGKDFLCEMLLENYNGHKMSITETGYNAAFVAFGLWEMGLDQAHFMQREIKDKPDRLFGKKEDGSFRTFREAVIGVCESQRAAFGDGFWAETLARKLRSMRLKMDSAKRKAGPGFLIVPDLGNTPSEVSVLARMMPNQCILVRIHRPHHSFGKHVGYEEAYGQDTGTDSRNWLFSNSPHEEGGDVIPSYDFVNATEDPNQYFEDFVTFLASIKIPTWRYAIERANKSLMVLHQRKTFHSEQSVSLFPHKNPTVYPPGVVRNRQTYGEWR